MAINPMAVIGRSVTRADAEEKVRGEAVYTMDVTLPGMLHAFVLRSQVAAGRILRLDTSAALRMPGVHAVVTHDDVPHLSGMLMVKDQTTFAHDDIRYVGEPIAAVAAESYLQARAAAAAIEVDITALDAIVDPERALDDNARVIHPDWASYEASMASRRNGNLVWENRIVRGSDSEFAAAFESAHAVVADTVRVPRQNQTPIEPHCVVAEYRAGRYTVHTSTQFPYMIRSRTAELLGVRPSKIRVIVPTVGGGFGGKLDAILEPIACALARRAGRPVSLVNSRREEFTVTGSRENAVVHLRTAVDREGRILAQESHVLIDNGANSSGETVLCAGVAPIALGCTYRVPLARNVTQVVYTNTAPTAAFRGVNGPYCIFALETHMDHVARTIGIDRREFRLTNLLRAGESMVTGQVLDDSYLWEAVEAVNRHAPWINGASAPPPGKLRGRALVPLTWLTNPGPGEASVRLTEDGTIMVTCAATEIGTGAVATGIRQIVAEVLGVDVLDVQISAPDTDAGGYDHGAQGSRTTFGMGNAALEAAEHVRAEILRVASGMSDHDVADLEIDSGTVVVEDDRRISFAEIAQEAMWSRGPIAANGRFVATAAKYDVDVVEDAAVTTIAGVSYHAHYAEVEVDTRTGKVSVLRYVVAQDVGRAINPAMIDGQVQGAVVQGLGYALFESLRFSPDGRPIESSFEDYRVPTALDVPAVELEILENPSATGPFGAKGAAEPPIVPVAGVIGCAIADAIGAEVDQLPLTPFYVLERLRSASGEAATLER